jgi:hypothetical protein
LRLVGTVDGWTGGLGCLYFYFKVERDNRVAQCWLCVYRMHCGGVVGILSYAVDDGMNENSDGYHI